MGMEVRDIYSFPWWIGNLSNVDLTILMLSASPETNLVPPLAIHDESTTEETLSTLLFGIELIPGMDNRFGNEDLH